MRFANREEYERWKASRTETAAPSAPVRAEPQPPAPAAEARGPAGWNVAALLVAVVGVAAFLVWLGYAAAPDELRPSFRTDRGPSWGRLPAVTAALTAAALAYLLRLRAAGRIDAGERVLRYPSLWRWIVPLVAAMCLFFLGYAIGMPKNQAFFLVVMSGLLPLSVWGGLEVFLAEVRLGAELVSKRTFAGRRVQLPWTAIRSVDYNSGAQWFVLRSDRATLRVSLYVHGLEALADELARRVPSLAAAPALLLMKPRRTPSTTSTDPTPRQAITAPGRSSPGSGSPADRRGP